MGILLNISGLAIDFDSRFPEYVRERCGKYLADAISPSPGKPVSDELIRIRVSEEDIDRSDVSNIGRMEAELYAMAMHLGEILPSRGRIMTHGVAVGCEGNSYIFTAKSGTGKSTHAFLWQKYLGADRVKVINGDKPILWLRDDGEILACGGPWNGKEHLDENVCLPLRGVCLLQRLEGNTAGGNRPSSPEMKKASKEETLDFLMDQIYLPRSSRAQIQTLQLLERMYDRVPVYHLFADMSREAVMVSSQMLSAR